MKYYKLNASGNDFVFFAPDNSELKADFKDLALRLCDRHKGIGADGMVAVFKGDEPNHIIWRFYNCDGSEANMCGNASRAAMLFAHEMGFVDSSKTIFLHTLAGVIEGGLRDICSLKEPDELAYFGQIATANVRLSEPKTLGEPFSESGYFWYFYDTGVPHLVAFVDDISKADMSLAANMRAKYNANVNFCQDKGGALLIRTFERGVEGETLACGTGMCASALAYRIKEPINSGVKTTIYPASKEKISVFLKGSSVYFEGQVNIVFSMEF